MQNRIFIKVLAFLVINMLCTHYATAQKDVPKDIILVLDNSGSMRQNDPQLLTKKVVSDFLTVLPADSQVGIVIFDEKVNLAFPLSPIVNEEAKQKALSMLATITYTGKLTDSPAGVERAIYELKSKGRKDAAKVIVFMTDGIVDTGNKARDVERGKWLREDLAAESKRLGIRIFGIAFTDQADFQLIQVLGETTGGGYFRALKADEIPGIFKEIDAAIQGPPSQPTEPRAQEGEGITIWLIVVVGIIVLGIVAIAVGRGRKGAASIPEKPVKVPKASLKDIREITGKHDYPISSPSFSIGRAATNGVVINKPTVSTKHATIAYHDNAFYLIDERSTNGTYVNGQRITGELRLKHNDRIRFDRYEFVLALEELADQMKTQLRGAANHTARAASQEPAQAPPSPQPDDEVPTKLKDMCPNHPSWKATELCPVCKTAFCDRCMVEKGGRKVCTQCAANEK